ncbi:uncharacterized protein PGTG_10318 [Puccinia graminis f. sp. tritici CRL 75-36-700-3]|uniref:Uncharacterized protein n=1 Tax=Puccinia graminis f. sp. tritici (strain CRL 75-36-700-3 / race SCCL) TaxID=418459 RepID=E3KKM2_PUCGT|nr:uncharacterized protein PGTG_10318 [Puccinia graminis f. sp. tritici CRL 75-36-700-3]EFP84847.1 hypothetical protein PGTG_10318 [Puccinia graminis f. sp. tritici CRL 75-36-700-3]
MTHKHLSLKVYVDVQSDAQSAQKCLKYSRLQTSPKIRWARDLSHARNHQGT